MGGQPRVPQPLPALAGAQCPANPSGCAPVGGVDARLDGGHAINGGEVGDEVAGVGANGAAEDGLSTTLRGESAGRDGAGLKRQGRQGRDQTETQGYELQAPRNHGRSAAQTGYPCPPRTLSSSSSWNSLKISRLGWWLQKAWQGKRSHSGSVSQQPCYAGNAGSRVCASHRRMAWQFEMQGKQGSSKAAARQQQGELTWCTPRCAQC